MRKNVSPIVVTIQIIRRSHNLNGDHSYVSMYLLHQI